MRGHLFEESRGHDRCRAGFEDPDAISVDEGEDLSRRIDGLSRNDGNRLEEIPRPPLEVAIAPDRRKSPIVFIPVAFKKEAQVKKGLLLKKL